MNKLFKRATAMALIVCLLCALAVPAMAVEPAEADYYYDFACADGYEFMADPGAGKPWVPRVFSPKSAYTKPDGTTVSAIASIPCSNDTGLKLWQQEYEAGNFDFTYEKEAANCKEQGSYQLQKVTVNEVDYTVILYKDGTAGDGKMGWGAIKIKAPAVGIYDVTLTYITQGSSGTNGSRNFLIPVSAMAEADSIGAGIAAVVASTDSKYELANTVNYADGKKANQKAELGTFVQDQPNEQEYYFVFTTNDDAKRVYLQALEFNQSAISANADNIDYNFGFGEKSMSVEEGALEEMATRYEAGTRDTMIAGMSSGYSEDKCKVEKASVYFGYSISPASNRTAKWLAFKFRAPGNGNYETTLLTNAATAAKSGSDFHVYLLDAAGVTDYAAAMTDANKICTSALSVENLNVELGTQTFVEGKEYLLILQGASVDGATQADNFYLKGLNFVEILPPAAKIGATEYLTVAEAAAAAKAGDVIKLMADHLGDIDTVAGVAIDLNGNTWTVSEYTATNANEYVIDSVGTGALNAGVVSVYGENSKALPLATDDGYSLAEYELTVNANDYEAVGSKTRFWFKLELEDAAAYDLIATGETGLTIGVELTAGDDVLAVTFDNGEGAEAFAAAWAAAAKNNDAIWLYADISGLANLDSLTVKPILQSADSTLWAGTITYTAG